MKRIALSFIAAVGVAGCANTFFPLASDQLFETQVRATCSFAFNCCEAVERGVVSLSTTLDESTCVEQNLEAGGALAVLGQRAKVAVDAGNAVYNGELAEKCLRPQLDAGKECNPDFINFAFDAECSAAFARAFVDGQLKDGDDCNDSLECADEGDCVSEEEDVITTSGKCLARAGEGDACSDRGCQTGLFCNFGEASPTCEKIELKDDGENCVDSSECESGNCVELDVGTCFDSEAPCEEDSDCEAENGDFCRFDFSEVCAPAAAGDDVEICNGRE